FTGRKETGLVWNAVYYRAEAEIALREVGRATKSDYMQWKNTRFDAAKRAYEYFWSEYLQRGSSFEVGYYRSILWRNVARAMAGSKVERLTAMKAHCARMVKLQELIQEPFTNFATTEAEIMVLDAKNELTR